MPIRSQIAVAAGRAGGSVSRRLRLGGGTSLPGAIAAKIDPNILSRLSAGLERGSIVVTATNGKTTTTNILADILRAAGTEPVHNAAGANLAPGIVTALMGARGREQKTMGLFEVDEATLKNVVRQISPSILSVGNIFRDQLDRFGEVDQTARLIAKGIEGLSGGSTVVLNADDPRVAALGREIDGRVLYYGLDGSFPEGEDPGAQDSKDCLICGTELNYAHRYFSHLGDYECPSCGFSRPEPQITAGDPKMTLKNSTFTLKTPEGTAAVNLAVPAIFNIYNALAAAAVSTSAGIGTADIVSGIGRFRPTFGRFESMEIEGRRLHLMLIKNPTGFNQAIRALNLDPAPKNVVFAINDNLADGTDVSWLWDADLERMGPTSHMVTTGIRAYDMALRLKYAGGDPGKIIVEPDFTKAIQTALAAADPGSDVYVLPTYTAMLDIRRRLEDIGDIDAFWQKQVAR